MSEDLISKEKAYKVLTEYYHHKTEMQHKALREALDMVPSVDVPDRKVGKWIDAKPMSGLLGKVCSCCNHEAYWDSDYGQQLFGWCPWCGAEMKGKGDAEID